MNNAKLLHIFFVFYLFPNKTISVFFFFCNSVLSFLYIKCRMVRRTLKIRIFILECISVLFTVQGFH